MRASSCSNSLVSCAPPFLPPPLAFLVICSSGLTIFSTASTADTHRDINSDRKVLNRGQDAIVR
eukprot:8798785-Pyramimonas_sp.AAC.1